MASPWSLNLKSRKEGRATSLQSRRHMLEERSESILDRLRIAVLLERFVKRQSYLKTADAIVSLLNLTLRASSDVEEEELHPHWLLSREDVLKLARCFHVEKIDLCILNVVF